MLGLASPGALHQEGARAKGHLGARPARTWRREPQHRSPGDPHATDDESDGRGRPGGRGTAPLVRAILIRALTAGASALGVVLPGDCDQPEHASDAETRDANARRHDAEELLRTATRGGPGGR